MAITDVLNNYNSEHGAARGSNIEEALKETLGVAGGGGGGPAEPLIVTIVADGSLETFDTTWQDIHDAFNSGRSVLVKLESSYQEITSNVIAVNITSKSNSPQYEVHFYRTSLTNYTTRSADGYPRYNYD